MKSLRLFLFACSTLSSSLSIAAEALCENCQITTVQPDSAVPGTLIYANVDSNWSNNGNCSSTSSQKRMYILKSEPMADQLYSAALASITSGYKVDIKGTGTCTGGIETVRFIKIKR